MDPNLVKAAGMMAISMVTSAVISKGVATVSGTKNTPEPTPKAPVCPSMPYPMQPADNDEKERERERSEYLKTRRLLRLEQQIERMEEDHEVLVQNAEEAKEMLRQRPTKQSQAQHYQPYHQRPKDWTMALPRIGQKGTQAHSSFYKKRYILSAFRSQGTQTIPENQSMPLEQLRVVLMVLGWLDYACIVCGWMIFVNNLSAYYQEFTIFMSMRRIRFITGRASVNWYDIPTDVWVAILEFTSYPRMDKYLVPIFGRRPKSDYRHPVASNGILNFSHFRNTCIACFRTSYS